VWSPVTSGQADSIETEDAVVEPQRVHIKFFRRPKVWREIVYSLGFYFLYSFVRNTFAVGSTTSARSNAESLIDLEKALGIFNEERIQRYFIEDFFIRPEIFVRSWNMYYGSFHFVVTVGALVFLFVNDRRRYALWRNVLAWTTGLALIGFSLYPLMPPRLIGAPFTFVDTLEVFGGLWSFDTGAVEKLSNQYAAMPSLHCAWATWCALALWPLCRHWWTKTLCVIYPMATLFAIVVTGNHFWLDAVGGWLTLAAGFAIGGATTRYWYGAWRPHLVTRLDALGLHPLDPKPSIEYDRESPPPPK